MYYSYSYSIFRTSEVYRMYVNMSVRMFVRMYVDSINLPTIQIVWKLHVDASTCKTRHSRLKIGVSMPNNNLCPQNMANKPLCNGLAFTAVSQYVFRKLSSPRKFDISKTAPQVLFWSILGYENLATEPLL